MNGIPGSRRAQRSFVRLGDIGSINAIERHGWKFAWLGGGIEIGLEVGGNGWREANARIDHGCHITLSNMCNQARR